MEKDMTLGQEAWIVTPTRYCMTSEHQLKRLDPTVQPFDLFMQKRKKIKHKQKKLKKKTQQLKTIIVKKNGLKYARKSTFLGHQMKLYGWKSRSCTSSALKIQRRVGIDMRRLKTN